MLPLIQFEYLCKRTTTESVSSFCSAETTKIQKMEDKATVATVARTNRDQKPLRFKSCKQRTISIRFGISIIISRISSERSAFMKSNRRHEPHNDTLFQKNPNDYRDQRTENEFSRLMRLSIPINFPSSSSGAFLEGALSKIHFYLCLCFLSFMIQHLLCLSHRLLLPSHRELKEPRARILFPTLQLREAAPRPREMTCKIRKIGRLLRSPFQKDILSL